MNYQKIYQNIINNRQQNLPSGYTEKHHIVPKCLGGTNKKENLVKLTAREHFIAHQLLVKIFPKEYGLIYAAFRMSNFKKYGSKKYAWLRELHSINLSERQKGEKNHFYGQHHSLESIQKMSESKKGKIFSAETRKKMSEGQKGKIFSAETRKKMSERQKGKFLSAEIRKKISESAKGKILSAEHKKKLSESQKGKIFSAEHKKKLSESRKGKTPNKGKIFSAEHKKKMSESRKGKKYQIKEKHQI